MANSGVNVIYIFFLPENYLTPDSYCFNGRIVGNVVKITREHSECVLHKIFHWNLSTCTRRKAEETPPNHQQAVADCIIDLPPKDCSETAHPEEREALPPSEDLPASPTEASVFKSEPPSTGKLQLFFLCHHKSHENPILECLKENHGCSCVIMM
jgi:hypothetical protein